MELLQHVSTQPQGCKSGRRGGSAGNLKGARPARRKGRLPVLPPRRQRGGPARGQKGGLRERQRPSQRVRSGACRARGPSGRRQRRGMLLGLRIARARRNFKRALRRHESSNSSSRGGDGSNRKPVTEDCCTRPCLEGRFETRCDTEYRPHQRLHQAAGHIATGEEGGYAGASHPSSEFGGRGRWMHAFEQHPLDCLCCSRYARFLATATFHTLRPL